MSNGSEPVVDLASNSRYELMRSKHVTVPLSVPRKLRWCGYIALLAALIGPVVATLPTAVRADHFAGNPTTTPLGAAAVVLIGVVAVAIAAAGLTAVAVSVERTPDPPESRLWLLIGAEDAFSGIGFITGALGVLSGGIILASGHWGPDAVDRLIASGIDPYLVFDAVPATPRLTAIGALLVGIGSIASSVVVERRRE
ncbi:hypothetical protein [Halorubrum sp. DTA46]|uniref:hypothetical protein n=1 Tax=Halorubrum sp. DTA46 TaxID=3402162 RepID=UPI003AADBC83